MNNVQVKVLDHVLSLLKKYDSFHIYNGVQDALERNNIDDKSTKDILKSTQESYRINNEVIREIHSWIESLKSDAECKK